MDRRRSGTDEREEYGVLSRIARFQMRRVIVRVGSNAVMLMNREAVVVLGVIVLVVDVGVQQRHRSRRGDERRDEQQCQRAVHDDESIL